MSEHSPLTCMVTYGRRVTGDAGEGLTEEEEQQRWDYAIRSVLEDKELPPPARPVPWCYPEGEARRATDPELDQVCARIEEELCARRPGAVRQYRGWKLYDFTGFPDLAARWNQAHDEGEERAIQRAPPLPVRDGDFVEVGGRPLRVAHLDRLHRTASLEVVDARGSVIAGSTGHEVDGLKVIPREEARAWLEAPPHLRDGLDIARFHKNALRELLRKEGLDD